MGETYLIEIRLARTKWRVKECVSAIAAEHRLEPFVERHPHVTLFGPLTLNEGTSEDLILAELGNIASRCGPVPFLIGNFEKREGMHGSVIAFSVHPSDALRSLTREVADAVSPLVTSLNAWDARPDHKWFHVTVANQLEETVASAVFRDLTSGGKNDPALHVPEGRLPPGESPGESPAGPATRLPRTAPLLIDEDGLRITVMRGEEILAEYDLTGRRWITGADIHDVLPWKETLSRFRQHAAFELTRDQKPVREIFLIGDLHLGHANIIRYCSRPFAATDPGEMDRVLTGNWNRVISPENPVYFLGDLCYGPDARPADEYLSKLNGKITLIRGNHDAELAGAVPSVGLEYDGLRFLLVHDPADAPPGFNGWVIHGHHHNNDLAAYPFISFAERRINVSAEVIGYVPVTLAELCERIQAGTGSTAPVLLRYPYTCEDLRV